MVPMLDWWRRGAGRELSRLRKDGRGALLWSLRLTFAATLSYVVGIVFFPGTQPLLAPLTAMLVVQVTPVSLLASGLDRVVAVVAGVLLAVGFAAVVPLHWWSLGVLIFVSITLGQALRLRSNLVEVAISGMLVLGVGTLGAPSAAWQRIAETLVGALVGIAANLVLPGKVASADAGRAIDGLADSVSELLHRSADELSVLLEGPGDLGDLTPAARGWLEDARRITHGIPEVGAALIKAEQGRRLNVRAVGTADAGPGLRQGLEALEHSAVAIRGMYRALLDATDDVEALRDERARALLTGLGRTFRDLAAGVDAFGQLVRDEADRTSTMGLSDVQTLQAGLTRVHEARARLEEQPASGLSVGLVELLAAVLSTTRRLLREMDLDERVRRQVQLVRRTRPRVTRPAPRATGTGRAGQRSGSAPGAACGPGPDPEDQTQVLPRLPDERGARPQQPPE